MLEFLNYTFIVRSLLVGSLFSVFAAFLGNFLVAGKRSNMSDMLSHFSLAGVGLGIFLGGGVGFMPIGFSLLAGFSLYFLSNPSFLEGLLGRLKKTNVNFSQFPIIYSSGSFFYPPIIYSIPMPSPVRSRHSDCVLLLSLISALIYIHLKMEQGLSQIILSTRPLHSNFFF